MLHFPERRRIPAGRSDATPMILQRGGHRERGRAAFSRPLRVALAAAAIGALSFFATFAAAAAHRALAAASPEPAELIVVLGGEFGNNPCRVDTDYRMIRGLEISARMPDATVVVSETVAPFPDLVRANTAILAHLNGLPQPDKLLVEPRAVSTFENVRFTVELLGERPEGRVILVTDPVHMLRARALWRYFVGDWPDYALARARGEPISRARLTYHMREAAAWWLNLGKVAAWEALALAGVDNATRGGMIR